MKKKYLFDFVCLFCILTLSCFIYYSCFGKNYNKKTIETKNCSNEIKTNNTEISSNTFAKFAYKVNISGNDINTYFIVDKHEMGTAQNFKSYNDLNSLCDNMYVYVFDLTNCGFNVECDNKNSLIRISKIFNYKNNNSNNYNEPIDNEIIPVNKNRETRIIIDGVEINNSKPEGAFKLKSHLSDFGFYLNSKNEILISLGWLRKLYSSKDFSVYKNNNKDKYELNLNFNAPTVYFKFGSSVNSPIVPIKITETLLDYGERNWGNTVKKYFKAKNFLTSRQRMTRFYTFPMTYYYYIYEPDYMFAPEIYPQSYNELESSKNVGNYLYSDDIPIFSEEIFTGYGAEKEYSAFAKYKNDYISLDKSLKNLYYGQQGKLDKPKDTLGEPTDTCEYFIDKNKLIITPNSLNTDIYYGHSYSSSNETHIVDNTILSAPISCIDLKLYSGEQEIVPDDGMPSFLCIDGTLYIKVKDFAKALNADMDIENSIILPK